ncbi:MAG: TSUP family transporter [Polyangiaceae bacterium]
MVELSSFFLLIPAAFTAGVVDAIAGGGGLITVPALLAAGLPPQLALATNKGQATFGAISSAASFWHRDGMDRERIPFAFIAAAIGSFAGARLLLAMKPEPLKPLVLAFLVFAAVLVALPPRIRPRARTLRHPRVVLVVVCATLGAYDGFFGPGVGSMLIVAFATLYGDSLVRASGNAKVANLASNLAALGLFAWRGSVLWHIALPMAAANAAGAFVGARLAIHRGDRFVRVVVLSVVGAVAVKLTYEILKG